jgi:hypothetical protein
MSIPNHPQRPTYEKMSASVSRKATVPTA